jgi:ribosome maturation factor RimP
VKNAAEQIAELIAPTVEALGLELWGIELQQQGKYSLLRVYIENREDGVSIEDCEKVSRQVSALLDVEDPISGEYTLEVSSPGMDRPLFTAEQFGLYVGETVNIRLRTAMQGRRKFKGVIERVNEGVVDLLVDGESVAIQLTDLDKANIDY